MFRFAGSLFLLAAVTLARADSFDDYTSPLLAKAAQAPSSQKVTKLTPEMMVDHSQTLPGVSGTFLVVKTNDNRWSRVSALPARQKISDTESVPIALIDRFVTFRDAQEKAVHANGKNVRLFADFRFNLDIGQTVPANLPADLKFVVDGDSSWLEPVGKAEVYLVTKHLPEAEPKKREKVVIGDRFEAKHFSGTFKLVEDGRRSGDLILEVKDTGEVFGHFYSDKDGKKYEVEGKVGTPANKIQFHITLPRTAQFYTGWMFTADGKAITGVARMEERETGFYAMREE